MTGFAVAVQQAAKGRDQGAKAVHGGGGCAQCASVGGNQSRLRQIAAQGPVQPKLEIGAVDDPLEREADHVADKVMRMADPPASPPPPAAPSNRGGGGGDDGGAPVVRPSRAGAPASARPSARMAPPSVAQVLSGSGRPLDPSARSFMEPRFGADFTAVRIHDDAEAAASARAIGASAYAVGSNLVFAGGAYSPDGAAGRRLLAHELAHVLQGARPGVVRRTISTPSPSDAAEVASHINGFAPVAATVTGSDVTAVGAVCGAAASAGVLCACNAMLDSKRVYNITPTKCDPKPTKEVLFDKTPATIPESSAWPSTSRPACTASTQIIIPKNGSTMEFGAFDPKGKPFWFTTSRILAHELCGHGVGCQTYEGEAGTRPQHDVTIATENQLTAPPIRGKSTDPRQGESFTNPIGDQKKVAFKQTDGWHYEAP